MVSDLVQANRTIFILALIVGIMGVLVIAMTFLLFNCASGYSMCATANSRLIETVSNFNNTLLR
jgi:hypothetical protein